MSTREQNDLYFGHPGFDQTPTIGMSLEEADPCGRCRHPRWMHSGYGGEIGRPGRCHMRDWEAQWSCRCENFVEPVACDGSSDCSASRHIHGCFADFGQCDEPGEHRLSEAR